MKKIIFIFFLFTIQINCSNSSEKPSQISFSKEVKPPNKRELKTFSLIDTSLSYSEIKKQVHTLKINAPDNFDSLSQFFKESLLHKIIPFWEGTKWSFEGHTEKPKIGTIACGYFISTTLKDVGFKIDRYKLAQQSPLNIAKSLAFNNDIKEINSELLSEKIIAMKEFLGEGIHFIGFDQNHVGYIYMEKNEMYLIHSNYLNAEGVMIESVENSIIFNSFNKFYIVKLSNSKPLLEKWKSNTRIEIIL